MKIAINYNVIDGPWGGGNRFVSALIDGLKENGHEVTNNLKSNNIDGILIVDPRQWIKNITFGIGETLRYLTFINSKNISENSFDTTRV